MLKALDDKIGKLQNKILRKTFVEKDGKYNYKNDFIKLLELFDDRTKHKTK